VQWGAVWKAGEIIDGQQPQQTLVAHMKRYSLLPSVQTLKGLLLVQMLKGSIVRTRVLTCLAWCACLSCRMNSTLRNQLLPKCQPTYAGYLAWRGVARVDELSGEVQHLLAGKTSMYKVRMVQGAVCSCCHLPKYKVRMVQDAVCSCCHVPMYHVGAVSLVGVVGGCQDLHVGGATAGWPCLRAMPVLGCQGRCRFPCIVRST
jgi:hypothetical protein